MGTVLADQPALAKGAATALVPGFNWTARDDDAENRCERESARQASWRVRLLGWLIEYNKY